MTTTTPAATAQRLLVSFLLAAVVFEGWAIYGLSRRVSRIEARSGLAALTNSDDRRADRDGDRGAPPSDPRDREGDRDPDRPQGRQDTLPEDRTAQGDQPEGRGDMPAHPTSDDPSAPREPGGQVPARPAGGGPNLERIAQEEKNIKENLEAYLGVTEFDDTTEAGLRAEVDRIFDTRRGTAAQGMLEGDDAEAREARIEADRERSTQEFIRLLGEDEARVFIDEVLRPEPPERRAPPSPDERAP